MLNYVLSAVPRGLGRDEWLQALPRALVAGFVKTDKEFQRRGIQFTAVTLLHSIFRRFMLFFLSLRKNVITHFCSIGETSGTTATFVIVDRWTVTVACVGDSRCVLDAQGGVVSDLTVDHRLEENVEE